MDLWMWRCMLFAFPDLNRKTVRKLRWSSSSGLCQEKERQQVLRGTQLQPTPPPLSLISLQTQDQRHLWLIHADSSSHFHLSLCFFFASSNTLMLLLQGTAHRKSTTEILSHSFLDSRRLAVANWVLIVEYYSTFCVFHKRIIFIYN